MEVCHLPMGYAYFFNFFVSIMGGKVGVCNMFLIRFFFIVSFFSSVMLWADLVPHRAHYKITLKSKTAHSDIEDISGSMVLEIRKKGKEWSLSQKSMTMLHVKNGLPEMILAFYQATESEQGDYLKFQAQKTFNRSVMDQVLGEASFSKKTGNAVTYRSPALQTVQISKNSIPPIQHLRMLIQTAKAGKTTLKSQVFDGSFFGKEVDINTFIEKPKAICKKASALGGRDVWAMNFAIYDNQESRSPLPSFEMRQNISETGVMCGYSMDFGTYAITGTLEKIEKLPLE
ncbi:MAG: DUF1849 family protein [Gammaproteobacteria bacterium]|nr:DUF1849 family protein [Gammaproteobacteria bacterium]